MDQNIPKEEQTIAAKRAARLHQKLQKRRMFLPQKSWWTQNWFELSAISIIFLLNIYMLVPFVGRMAPRTTYSGPIIPLLAKVLSLIGSNIDYSIQGVYIFFMALFPLSFYFFIRNLVERKTSAILAVLISTLPTYPFLNVRLEGAFIEIEGPHILALTLVPVALYGLLIFLRKGTNKYLLLAVISGTLIALSSPFTFMTFLIFAVIATFSEMLLGHGRLKLARLALLLLAIGGLNSFWYNPAFFFWMIVGPMGDDIRSMVYRLIPISFFTLPILITFGYLLFDRKPHLQHIFLASFFTLAFSVIVLAGGGFVPHNPSRYAPEFGISLSFCLGLLIVKLSDYVKDSQVKPLKRIPLPSTVLARGILLTLGASLTAFIVISGAINRNYDNKVLGIWTGVERSEIWVQKDHFGGIFSYVGFGISLTTLILLTHLAAKKTSPKSLSNA